MGTQTVDRKNVKGNNNINSKNRRRRWNRRNQQDEKHIDRLHRRFKGIYCHEIIDIKIESDSMCTSYFYLYYKHLCVVVFFLFSFVFFLRFFSSLTYFEWYEKHLNFKPRSLVGHVTGMSTKTACWKLNCRRSFQGYFTLYK